MPIYEFYCERCNTIYNFFSRSVNTDKVPNCPKCNNAKLQRRMSVFATISNKKDDSSTDDNIPPIDEAKMEKAMAMLASEADKIKEDDPRQAAKLMRKLTNATGLNLGQGMEEALSRMEHGENPDEIEAQMGDLLAEEDPFVLQPKARTGSRKPKPKVDETLYEL
ncbi:MAG: zinc ribbon domain-containing protein [Deltaproteobacteria bacterium]|nr:zinc ribbon domain-containing protein [Deltaproteobacteria bacterium]